MRPLLALGPEELRRAFVEDGVEPYRAGQVLRWIYARGRRDFASMSDLPAALRTHLAGSWSVRSLTLASVASSADGSEKLVLRTADGASVETVLIPEGRRRTICVSSQIGCSLDCVFCATARLGLGRNLGADEIVDQVLVAAERLASAGERPSHVVFMGMGEPLLNLGAVVQAIRVLSDPSTFGLSQRRFTISTAGVVPRMAELGRQVRARLAVSLHATTDVVRDRLVPLNRRFPIAALIEACRVYPLPPRERMSFEYTLIRDTNDGRDDARRLVRLLHGLRAGVNLIPLNEHAGTGLKRPEEPVIEHFASVLAQARIPVTIRRSRGEDVFAACGQLGTVASGPGQAVGARVR